VVVAANVSTGRALSAAGWEFPKGAINCAVENVGKFAAPLLPGCMTGGRSIVTIVR
jgi:hypothetical protein